MAPHSSTLAWKIPWTEEPRGLQSMGSWRVRHNWATSLSLFTFMHWRRKWQPTPVFLPGESQGRGAWWAAVYRVTQIRTWLKWLSSSSSSSSTEIDSAIDCTLLQISEHSLISLLHCHGETSVKEKEWKCEFHIGYLKLNFGKWNYLHYLRSA